MVGKLTLEELNGLVASGDIDTALVVQADMQGRLMGKRFHAEFFVDSAWEETHSCNYLQAIDMEMLPWMVSSRPHGKQVTATTR